MTFNMLQHLYVLDEDKNLVQATSIEEWGAFFQSEKRIVAQDTVGDKGVSTVFLGTDQRLGMGKTPLIFETAIFKDGELDNIFGRVATWAEAEKMHAQALQSLEA